MITESQIKKQVVLAPYTYYKIGGEAELFFEAGNKDDLKSIIYWAIKNNRPYLILGGGANVVVPDEGLKDLVIINKTSEIIYKEDELSVICDSGVSLREFVKELAMKGWAGLESLANIPGTVGGAVVGNAGAYGHSISEEISWITFIDPEGEIIKEGKDFFRFEYRTSRIKQGYKATILEICFKLYKKNPNELLKIIEEDLNLRKSKHPWEPSCGSFFKNVSRDITAAKLIEEAGLKGTAVGGAQVSLKHANFIINTGNATAKDIKELASLITQKVKQTSGYELEREVVYL
jgi:UDP-N-acetylmuramate dehydrogenase